MEQGTIPKSKLFSFQIETEFSDKKSGIFEAVRASGNVLCVCVRMHVCLYMCTCVLCSPTISAREFTPHPHRCRLLLLYLWWSALLTAALQYRRHDNLVLYLSANKNVNLKRDKIKNLLFHLHFHRVVLLIKKKMKWIFWIPVHKISFGVAAFGLAHILRGSQNTAREIKQSIKIDVLLIHYSVAPAYAHAIFSSFILKCFQHEIAVLSNPSNHWNHRRQRD